MAQELQPGEHVSWNYGAGQAKGQVVEKLTENKKLGSRVFKASPDDPKYLVKSDTSGKEAIKKPETLHKLDEDAEEGSAPEESPKPESTQDEHESDADASRQEIGAKEKRDGFKQRCSNEEKKEDDPDELANKALDTGKGSARASARAAKDKLKEDAEVLGELAEEVGEPLDVEGSGDKVYQPKKGELENADEEDEGPVNLGEVIAKVDEEAKEEGLRVEARVEGEGGAEDKENQPTK